jgi:hypothetical protein
MNDLPAVVMRHGRLNHHMESPGLLLSQLITASLTAVVSVAVTSMLIVFGIRLHERAGDWIGNCRRIWRSIIAVCMTTLGYGDIVPDKDWQLIAGMDD